MTAVYAATTPEWLKTIAALPASGRVAFWQPTPANPRRIKKGERWYFKELRRPVIRGFGIFQAWEELTISELFRRYGDATGYETEAELLSALQEFNGTANATTPVGNVVLNDVQIYPQPLRLSDLGLNDLSVRFVYLNESDPMAGIGYPAPSSPPKTENGAGDTGGAPTTGPSPSAWTKEVKSDPTKEAYVYALRFGSHDLWKVGWAVDVKKRLKMINDHIPDEIVPDKWSCKFFERMNSKEEAYRAEQAVLTSMTTFRTRGERVACNEDEFTKAWLAVVSELRSQQRIT